MTDELQQVFGAVDAEVTTFRAAVDVRPNPCLHADEIAATVTVTFPTLGKASLDLTHTEAAAFAAALAESVERDRVDGDDDTADGSGAAVAGGSAP